MIQFSEVAYYYDATIPVVKNISLTINKGETIALIGQNGSGKTTLMKLISGILSPTNGIVTVDGITTNNKQNIWNIRQKVGFVFQHPDDQIISNTVITELAFGPENLGLTKEEIQKRLDEVIELLKLQAIRDVPLDQLSLGEKQRVAIASILAMHPQYLILDEPTTFLPPELTKQFIKNLHELAKKQKVSIIMSAHSMEDVLSFDRCIVTHQGDIAFDGTPRNLFADVKKIHDLGLTLPEKKIAKLTHDSGLSRIDGIDSGCGLSALPETKTLFKVNHLSHTYLSGTPFERTALEDLSLNIMANSFTAIVGTTESGKTTLVDCLSGIINKPHMVLFENQPIINNLKTLRKKLGVVYQDAQNQIIADIVGKDITLGIQQKVTPQESREIVKESLEAVGLSYEEFRNRYTYTLSGGEYQRIAIAGVLAQNPEILILDEPTAGLDPQAKAGFLSLIYKLYKEKNLTIIYFTMHPQDIQDMADVIYALKEGRIQNPSY